MLNLVLAFLLLWLFSCQPLLHPSPLDVVKYIGFYFPFLKIFKSVFGWTQADTKTKIFHLG